MTEIDIEAQAADIQDENQKLSQQLEETLHDLNSQIEETSELYEQVWALYHLFGLFGRTTDLELIPIEAVKFCVQTIGATKAFICRTEGDKGVISDVIGFPEQKMDFSLIGESELLFQYAIENMKTVIVNDFRSDARMKSHLCGTLGLEKVICTPLTLGDKNVGFIVIGDPDNGEDFTAGHGKLVTSISHPVANVMENARLRREELEKKLMDRELEIAKEIQERLLPKFPTDLLGASLDGRSVSALAIGGDYFDFFRLDSDRVSIALADAVGKGVSAGLLMTMLKGMLHVLPLQERSPSEVMHSLNEALCRQQLRTHFVTMIYFTYEVSKQKATLCVAGHEPPLVFRSSNGEIEEYQAPSLPLGLSDSEKFPEVEIHLTPGDALIGYSDGLTEAKNENREEFGIKRLKEVIERNVHRSASEMAQALYQEAFRHSGSSSQDDDMTSVIVKAEIVDLPKRLEPSKDNGS